MRSSHIGVDHAGLIPVLNVTANCLPSMWEQSLLKLWNEGCRIRTEYDAKDKDGRFIDPPSVDSTMVMTCLFPDSEPMIHKAFPGGLEDLEEYRMEVVEGVKDHWIGHRGENPEDQKWAYTYHQKLTKWQAFKVEHTVDDDAVIVDGIGAAKPVFVTIDQIEDVVNKMARSPYSRRVQAITWDVTKDPDHYDPPCLQSMWFRILPDHEGIWRLNMNVRFRSRDAYDAAFMNCYALVKFQQEIARQIGEKAGRPVKLGHYCDISDSYHIYGRRHEHFKSNFLKLNNEREFEDRTFRESSEQVQWVFEEARKEIKAKITEYDGRSRT